MRRIGALGGESCLGALERTAVLALMGTALVVSLHCSPGPRGGGDNESSPSPASLPNAGLVEKALPFVEDDYPRALAAARERQVPLFIEAWAPC